MLILKSQMSVSRTVAGAAALLLCTLSLNSVCSGLPQCSGQQPVTGNCGTDRTCPVYNATTNPNCTGTAFSAKALTVCAGGNSGDNCIRTTELRVCAIRYQCLKNNPVDGVIFLCYFFGVLGSANDYKIDDGGNCIVGGM